MKKAQVLSTICISVASALVAVPVLAQVPAPGTCFTRSYDDAHLAANPAQGVRSLTLWFYDAMRGDAESRSVIVEASMADQGQARADGVGGQTLRQTSACLPGDQAACYVDCDGGWFTTAPRGDGGLEVVTDRYMIGTTDSCGGFTDLAEGGARTVYRLAAAPVTACADLARVYPLPQPGCYAGDNPRAPSGAQVVLRLDAPDLQGAEPAFPWLEGVLASDIGAGAGQPAVMVPVWCAAADGQCRSGMDEGGWAVTTDGDDVILTSAFFALYDADGAMTDLTGGAPTRLVLSRQPAATCDGLVLE